MGRDPKQIAAAAQAEQRMKGIKCHPANMRPVRTFSSPEGLPQSN
jgi:hypothetical protein